jgi:hypothetical protein
MSSQDRRPLQTTHWPGRQFGAVISGGPTISVPTISGTEGNSAGEVMGRLCHTRGSYNHWCHFFFSPAFPNAQSWL